jgi:hypothetical protein
MPKTFVFILQHLAGIVNRIWLFFWRVFSPDIPAHPSNSARMAAGAAAILKLKRTIAKNNHPRPKGGEKS